MATLTSQNLNEDSDDDNGESSFTRIDGPWSKIMCALLFLCSLFLFGCTTTYGILFPSVSREFNSGRTITAMPGALSTASSSLFGPVIGRFCDSNGCRKAMLIGGVCCAVGLVVSSFAPVISVLVLSYGLLFGVGLSFIYNSSMIVVPVYFDEYKFEATSVVSTGHVPGLLVMTPIIQALNKGFGWRTTLLSVASFSAFSVLVGCLMRDKKSIKIEAEAKDNRPMRRPSKCCCRKLVSFAAFRVKAFVLATSISMIGSLGHQMPFVHLARFCDDIGISSNLSSWLYFTIGISSTITRLFVSKFGKKGCLTLPNILLLGLVFLAIGNYILPSVLQYHWLVLYCINYGIGDGLYAVALVNILIECLPDKKRGGGFGLWQFFLGLVFIAGPVLSGFIADTSGSYNYAFYTAGSLEALGGILCLFFRWFQIPIHGRFEPDDFDDEMKITERETVHEIFEPDDFDDEMKITERETVHEIFEPDDFDDQTKITERETVL